MADRAGELSSMRPSQGERLLADALATGMRIAAALVEWHRRRGVHGALRPATIHLDADGARLAEAGASPVLAIERLQYASPEQTGRIDRAVDARSDLYALGLVLHELFAGAPPIRTDDPLELIHWHLAGAAPALDAIDPRIPPIVGAIVARLLAKSPDDRYQSAAALHDDLARCAAAWAAEGRIEPFALGRRDAGERFVVSSRLYGREREVRALLDAFAGVCAAEGKATLLLVEGYSGIGKTALIQQLYRPIVREHGCFVSGKFDQVVRGVPFGALIQAFRGLVRQLLTESEARLAAWRERLDRALGINAGVLAEVIPEIAFIIGPRPAPPALDATETRNRFERVLQNFLGALAAPAHPLVIFLDDLQWADAASLALLEPLLAGGIRGLLVIGACRDNELAATPHLARVLAALEGGGVAIERIALGPLALPELSQLVADTLRTGAAEAAPLAQLIHAKTGGNPFFVTQFLRSLAREGHLRFDPDAMAWRYRIDEIADAPLADNVVDLTTRSIGRLPPAAQYVLTLAACIGNRFDLRTLAIVSEQSEAASAAELAPAVAEGLVVGVAVEAGAAPAYAFLHDRVQQAAYALIPAERRAMLHLSVGRLLLSRRPFDELDARALFDIVHHLDLGLPLIRARAERIEVAALNLQAGRRAKASTAHDSARALFEAGNGLLDEAAWQSEYPLAFALGLELAESRYLCGAFDAAQELLARLDTRAAGPIDRARVVRLRSVQYENMARYADALGTAREGLALFGVAFPDAEADKEAALEREIEAIERLRGGRDIAALVDLPVMADAGVRMVMTMLTDIWSAAYIVGDPTLARLISATLVRLSLEHGNVEESAYGYVTHAITVGPIRGGYDAAYRYGLLALAVNQRFGDLRRRAKIHQQFHAHVNLWCRPYASGIEHAREACRSGLESGDFLYAAYGAGTEPWAAMMATQDLAQFVRDHEPSVALIEKLKNPGFADSVRALLGWARALQGGTRSALSLGGAGFDEDAYLARHADNPFFTTIHAVAHLQVCCLLGDAAEAQAAAQRSARTAHLLPGTVWPVAHDFWHGLALTRHAESAAPGDRTEGLAPVRAALARLESMAPHCELNFRAPALLLGAAIASAEGRAREAQDLLEAAVEFTAGRPLLPYQALAHELLGRLHGAASRDSLAALHLAEARRHYARWGATAKADAMAAQYPVLRLESDTAAGPPASSTASGASAPASAPPAADAPGPLRPPDDLDLFSVMKAAQAIAGEVELAALMARLMAIALQNAGAETGCLVLEGEAGPLAWPARAAGAGTPVLGAAVPLDQADLPVGIVNYVRRTGEGVVLDEAAADERHGAEPYIVAHRPRSLACLPVQRQGRPIGVLYLDNRRVGGAFTAPRLRVLGVLAAQAAIALENARLVGGLRDEIAERRRAQEQLAAALGEVERLRDDLEAENSYLRRDLIANVSHDLRTPLVSMRGYLEVLATQGEKIGPELRRSHLAIAVRQSEHLARLIDELFELAKLDFKGIRLEREPFQAAELASDVIQKFQLAADGRGVKLALHARAGLPPVDGDLGLLERVLENLIGNALQHTPAQGRVDVRLEALPEGVRIEVADTGAGIEPADLPFVFDRYYRGASAGRSKAGGAGLGLAITRRILDLHGVAITAEGRHGAGACFAFTLPAAAPDASG